MEEEKENSSLSQAQQYPTSYLQDQDLINISKILAECDPSAFELCANEMIDPDSLDFIPKGNWTSKPTSLDSLRDTYFGRKNNVNRRFEHKLWNALRITAVHPSLIRFVGVCWVNNNIIKVYKQIFAKLLNIKVVDGKARRLSKTCDFCLACVQNCPFKAIDLDRDKNPKARYRHPKISLKEIVQSNHQ